MLAKLAIQVKLQNVFDVRNLLNVSQTHLPKGFLELFASLAFRLLEFVVVIEQAEHFFELDVAGYMHAFVLLVLYYDGLYEAISIGMRHPKD